MLISTAGFGPALALTPAAVVAENATADMINGRPALRARRLAYHNAYDLTFSG